MADQIKLGSNMTISNINKHSKYLKIALVISIQFAMFAGHSFAEDLSDRVSEKLNTLTLDAHSFDISNYHGEVKISGWASSEEDRRAVLDTVRKVKGVDKIEESILIKKSSSTYSRNDPQTEHKLESAKLASEKYLNSLKLKGAYDLKYEIDNQGLTISGELPSGTNKEALVENLKDQLNIPVSNRILVRPWPTDSELSEKVRYSLGTKDGINLDGVSISVSNGIVTLSGHRSNHHQADQLATAVLMIEGVRGLDSKVTFDGSRNDP